MITSSCKLLCTTAIQIYREDSQGPTKKLCQKHVLTLFKINIIEYLKIDHKHVIGVVLCISIVQNIDFQMIYTL